MVCTQETAEEVHDGGGKNCGPQERWAEIQTGEGLNIYQKLHEVMKAVGYIQKDTKVQEGGGYMAVSHDNVTAMVRPHFIAQGIVMTVSQIESKMEPTGTVTGKGTPIIRYQGWYEVSFVNAEDPGDRVMERVEAHANDTGDKAPGKAMTYASKYAVLKVLMLETGIADESRYDGNGEEPANEIKPYTATDVAREALAAMPADEQKFLQESAVAIIDVFEKHGDVFAHVEKLRLDNDETLAIWSLLPSKVRTELKRMKRELEKQH